MRSCLKKALTALVVLLLLLSVTLVLAPYWLPWLAVPLLRHLDVQVDTVEAADYNRLKITALHWQAADASLSVQIETIEAPNLWAWLGAGLRHREIPPLIVEGWTISLNQVEETELAESEQAVDLRELFLQASSQLHGWQRWTPQLKLHRGRLNIADTHVLIDPVHYVNNTLTLQGSLADSIPVLDAPSDFALALEWPENQPLHIHLAIPGAEIEAKLNARLTDAAPARLEVDATVSWHDNRIPIQASWADHGLLPTSALVSFEALTLPPGLVDMAPYNDCTLNGSAQWTGEELAVDLSLSATPDHSGPEHFPPLSARLEGVLAFDHFTLNTLHVNGQWIEVQLSAPLEVVWDDLQATSDATLDFKADFSQQSILPLNGTVLANAEVIHRHGAFPQVNASGHAHDLQTADITLTDLQFQATLDWPHLHLQKLDARLGTQSMASIHGSVDLEAQSTQHAELSLSLYPEDLGGILRDYPVGWDILTASAEFSGPWLETAHQGNLSLKQLAVEGIPAVDFSIEWDGVDSSLARLGVEATSDLLSIIMDGSMAISDGSVQAEVSALNIRIPQQPPLNLQAPFNIKAPLDGSSVDFSRVHLEADNDTTISAFGQFKRLDRGHFEISVDHFGINWIDPLLPEQNLDFPLEMTRLRLQAKWDDGPLELSLSTHLNYLPDDQPPIDAHLNLHTGLESVRLEELLLRQDGRALVTGNGSIPLILNPANPAEPYTIDPAGPLELKLETLPNPEFWALLQRITGVELENPELNLLLSGTTASPRGQLEARIQRAAHVVDDYIGTADQTEAEVTDIVVQLILNESGLHLERMQAVVEGHKIDGSGLWPMTSQTWQSLWNNGTLPDWDQARGRIVMADTPIEAFKEFLPDILRPSGTFSIQAMLEPGKQLTGELRIQGGQTMPIMPLGILESMEADISFHMDEVVIRSMSARVGERPVTIEGSIGIADLDNPVYRLKIKGERVPFVRMPGLILRGSPELSLNTNPETMRTTLSGDVTLNESFVVMDLASLLDQRGGGTPATRPPFFSVEDQPVADWYLRLKVKGDDFMRVRTPVMEGRISADFDLRGTFREPFAFGHAAVDRGVILFPFAAFRIQQGTVRLRQSDPYRPMLDMTATARLYGYDLRMELSGTMDDPALVFTSTPSLDSSEILLMVTTGQIPTSDLSRSTASRLSGLGVFLGKTVLADLGLVDPLDDSLEIRVGENITDSGRDTLEIEYHLSPRWSIQGQYDRFDAYNMDLKWRIFSR